ncbi:hypothetical protein [Chondrinema litorale]|uniref:hypothetical protein n=1 Tax=Chondrinema litorale TaxID=2994555 RepID=UPI0025439695|nr:hypothetical protein [Chondrinema litorale]UZR95945.1 hypothetical protein OQ292_08980 [Chondrinema litorale]
MEVADIITEFGAYYINQGQNMSRLYKLLLAKSITEQLFTTVRTDDTRWLASKATVGRVLQPFQKSWTPLAPVEFKPVAIDQFKLKMDSEEYPDDVEATWLGFLADNDLDRKQWPIVRYIVEELLIPQIKEDYELLEVFLGEQANPAEGTAGDASTGINGIRKIVNDHITGGRITPIVTGAPDADDVVWVEQIESFVDAINQKYWGIKMPLGMSEMNARRFLRGYKAKYGQNTDYKDNTTGKVDFSNVNVLGCPSFGTSNKILCTPKNNAIQLSKKAANESKVKTESEDRKVKIFTDFWRGVGFVIPEIVFTNDQDLAA